MVLLVACLVGLLTGSSVVLFNAVIHLIRDLSWSTPLAVRAGLQGCFCDVKPPPELQQILYLLCCWLLCSTEAGGWSALQLGAHRIAVLP